MAALKTLYIDRSVDTIWVFLAEFSLILLFACLFVFLAGNVSSSEMEKIKQQLFLKDRVCILSHTDSWKLKCTVKTIDDLLTQIDEMRDI